MSKAKVGLGLAGLGLVGLGLWSWLGQPRMQVQELLAQPVASSLPSCYSRYRQAYQAVLGQYRVEAQSVVYTLLEVAQKSQGGGEPVVDRLVFRENQYGRCQLLNEQDKESSLLAWVPEVVAVALERQVYEKIIAKYGKAKLQAEMLAFSPQVDARTWPEVEFLFPEKVKALEQLGIRLPPGVIVLERACELARLNPRNKERLKEPKFVEELQQSCPPLQRYRGE